jgi:hypothetical protein
VRVGFLPSLTPFATARTLPSLVSADKIALELGQAAEHREHEAAVCRYRCIAGDHGDDSAPIFCT